MKANVEKVVIMVQRTEVKQRQHGTVMIKPISVLVIVNAALKVSSIEASCQLFPVTFRVSLVPVTKPGVNLDLHV